MAIIQFTAGDALQTVMAEAGNYPMIIPEIDGPKASSSQKSVSYYVKFVVTEGPLQGKEWTVAFNSGTKNQSVLNGMQYVPQSTFLALDAAINGTKVEPVAKALDTDSLLNKPFTGIVAVQTDEGKLVNVITGFLKSGAAAAGTPF